VPCLNNSSRVAFLLPILWHLKPYISQLARCVLDSSSHRCRAIHNQDAPLPIIQFYSRKLINEVAEVWSGHHDLWDSREVVCRSTTLSAVNYKNALYSSTAPSWNLERKNTAKARGWCLRCRRNPQNVALGTSRRVDSTRLGLESSTHIDDHARRVPYPSLVAVGIPRWRRCTGSGELTFDAAQKVDVLWCGFLQGLKAGASLMKLLLGSLATLLT